MFSRHSLGSSLISLVTLACFIPAVTGCHDAGPRGESDGVRTRVVLTDSAGEETVADLDFELEVEPSLAILEGGAPAAPERIFASATAFRTTNGRGLAFAPQADGSIAVRLDGDLLPISLRWSPAAATLVFAGSGLSTLSVRFEGVRAYDREAGLFALSTLATLATTQSGGANVEPISTTIIVIAVIGLAAYLACITLGCNYMCKNNCEPHGVDSCGCGIVTNPNGGTDFGYSCNCRKAAPTPAPTATASSTPVATTTPSATPGM